MLSTILIIDKRKELSTKYKKVLESFGVKVNITYTLKDAMSDLQTIEPDLIIVSDSIGEPLTTFCQRIRALTFNTRPIIVALSKSADFSDRISVLENGADDFISEPVNIDEFKTRIKAHLRRDIEFNLNTKTLLPNIVLVKKALKRHLYSDNQAVLLCDIQNLQQYQSVYSEVAGDKIIQTFIAIAKSILGEEDFIGQYADNVFVIITNKYAAEKIAEFIPFAFDTVVSKFYSQKDIERGYMLLKGEHSVGMRINFVSVLIGCMTEGFGNIPTVDILIDRLFSIKNMAKLPSGSNYIVERAKITATNSVIDKVSSKSIYIKEDDASLKLLLRTTLELQGYDVKENLDLSSAIQPDIIILDAKNDLSELTFLKEMKNMQNFVNTKFIVTTTVHDKYLILNSGADLYLPKPYEISDVISWVEYFYKNMN